MASKNFTGYLRDPLTEFATQDKWIFTHMTTTGEVIKGSVSRLTIPDDGLYDIDIQYGNVNIQSKDSRNPNTINHGTYTINSETVATTLPSLLNSTIPVTTPEILAMEALLQDAQDAADDAQSSADDAQAAVDSLGTAGFADLTTSPTDITAGRVLKVGDFGLGGAVEVTGDLDSALTAGTFWGRASRVTSQPATVGGTNTFTLSVIRRDDRYVTQTLKVMLGATAKVFERGNSVGWSPWYETWSEINTTVDGSGFIKEASPIVKLFADTAEFNAQCPDAADFKKVSTGHYLIKNTLGFAQKGWYIETPKDANNNVKVYVEYEQLPDNTLEIKTFEPDYSTGKITGSVPADIPSGRWIDLRLEKQVTEEE